MPSIAARAEESRPQIAEREAVLYRAMLHNSYLQGDRLFAVLMGIQWVAAVGAAIWISPRAWEGLESQVSVHVWAALFLGGVVTIFPVILALTRPGEASTRQAIAIGQMLMTALLIHLTGGRIETHFDIFVSLAFLAVYRDWRVLLSATVVVILDHALRGYYWPQSVYGVDIVQPLRFIEHGAWVLFDDCVLMFSIRVSLGQLRRIAHQQVRLETVNGEIEQKVVARTAELVEAREVALAASNAKSEFLSSMSHEIRTPMTSILGMEELLQDTTLNEEERNYLDIMRNNSNALLALINNILDLAKVEGGQLRLEHIALDLEHVVEKSLEIFGFRAHAKGLELAARIMPDVPTWVLGDPLRLRQILLNLIGNALKFTESGEIVVTVGREEHSATPDTLHFTVSDSGIGIPEDKLESIFSDFSQVDSSTTRNYGGTGLGLAIVNRMTELMGGRVWVESTVGHGSAFHFTAVLEAAPPEVQALEPVSNAVNFKGMRVLVVDDNQFNRLVLREILSRAGAEVTEAADGLAALRLYETARAEGDPYNLMLLDARMPEMDGFEVAQRIGSTQRPVVVMLTSDGMKDQLAQVRDLGLDAYLIKPVRRTELFDAIGVAINGRDRTANGLGKQPGPKPAVPTGDGAVSEAGILVVDDSADNRLLVRAFLKDTGYEIDEAADGVGAIEKFRSGNYAAILMDMRMPVMGGIEAIRAIRDIEKDETRRRTPIIALTASALTDDEKRTRDAGADAHVSKPVRRTVLLQAIDQVVGSPDAEIPQPEHGEIPKAVA